MSTCVLMAFYLKAKGGVTGPSGMGLQGRSSLGL